ncbi:MAG: helix-hairpin-helix domain-containing protein [Bacteroidota bacterium]
MEFLQNIFTGIDQQESLYFLAFLLGAFLLGFIVAWILWGSRANRWKKEAQKSQGDLQALQVEYNAFKEQYEIKEAELQKANLELEEMRAQQQVWQDEKDLLQRQLTASRNEQEALQETVQSYQNNVEDLNNQIIGLKAKNVDLQNSATAGIGEATNGTQSTEYIESAYQSTLRRLANVEERLNSLATENAGLKQELDQVKANSIRFEAPIVEQPIQPPVLDLSDQSGEEATYSEAIPEDTPSSGDLVLPTKDLLAVEASRAAVQNWFGHEIPQADSSQKDDLKKIDGIGPFLEAKLNELGFYTYEQLSLLDATMIEELTTAIEFFPGRIERDNWVVQAYRLAETKGSEEAPIVVASNHPDGKEATDLKIIEGVGPKIEELLKENGIQDWNDLREAEVEQLHEILISAGDHMRVHDPSTWPQQAQLAATGEWEKLKEYQDFLNGGKEK